MTRINLIEKKKERLSQLRNRVRSEESLLKYQERKARTRKLIELGGLIAKAQLDHLPSNTLYGSFLHLQKQLSQDAKILEQWAYEGGVAFAQKEPQKSAIIVSFSEKPSPDTCLQMRALGLKWSAIRQEWQGYVVLPELRAFLKGKGAEIHEIATDIPR